MAPTLEEAVILRQRLKESIVKVEAGLAPAKSTSWTLEEAVEKTFQLHWKDTADSGKQRIHTRHLLNFFGKNYPINNITAERVVEFRSWAEKVLGNSPNTVNKKVMALSRALRTANDLGKLEKLPKMYIAV